MKFEPLIYFSALLNSSLKALDFAEYDTDIDNPFMGTYHFVDMTKECEQIQTIWYDFYTKKFYKAIVDLTGAKNIFNEHAYIDICYSLGGFALIWVINLEKSVLIQRPSISITQIDLSEPVNNNDWDIYKTKTQHQFDLNRDKIEKQIQTMNAYIERLITQYTYRYLIQYENWDEAYEEWYEYGDDVLSPEFENIEVALYDGTHDKSHDGRLLNYHTAGRPKKMKIKWHFKNSEYSAYLWFKEFETSAIFNYYYETQPNIKMDILFRIDSEQNKYELALYHEGLDSPLMIDESVYQLIVFKNSFEHYRSENYDQPSGAWIW